MHAEIEILFCTAKTINEQFSQFIVRNLKEKLS